MRLLKGKRRERLNNEYDHNRMDSININNSSRCIRAARGGEGMKLILTLWLIALWGLWQLMEFAWGG